MTKTIAQLIFTLLSITLLLPFLSISASAQTTNAVAKAFQGKWVSYDRAHAAQSNCTLEFLGEKGEVSYPIRPIDCSGKLASVTGWKIEKNQLVFVSITGASIALVGGNQERLSGFMTASNPPIIFEKKEAAQKIERARKTIKCSYVGYSQICARPQQFAPPPASFDAPALIKILVNLNVRSEPRNNSRILTILKPNACVSARFCTLASDGLWCQIKSEKGLAWVKKQTVRQKKWPIITFENGCS